PQVLHAERFGDELQVLFEVLVTKRRPQEPAEEPDHVVFEPVAVHDRDNVVLVWRESRRWDLGDEVLPRRTLIGKDQPGLVETITTERATYEVRHEVYGDLLCALRLDGCDPIEASGRGLNSVRVTEDGAKL